MIRHLISLQAIAWCPWENSKVLATGGGHSDGYLRFWNNSNGTCQKALKTDSQVPRTCHEQFAHRRNISLSRFRRSYGQLTTNNLSQVKDIRITTSTFGIILH